MATITYRNFERLRDAAGIRNNYQTAVLAGVRQYVLTKWKNKGLTPKVPTLMKIAAVFECQIEDFYAEDPEDGQTDEE